MKRILLFSISILLCLTSASAAKHCDEALGRYFLIGTAANTFQVSGRDPAIEQLIADQFNAVTSSRKLHERRFLATRRRPLPLD